MTKESNLAIEYWTKASELGGSEMAFGNLATGYLCRGDLEDSYQAAVKLADSYPTNNVGWEMVAQALFYKHEFVSAIEAQERAIRLLEATPAGSRIHAVYGSLADYYWYSGNQAKAQVLYKKASEIITDRHKQGFSNKSDFASRTYYALRLNQTGESKLPASLARSFDETVSDGLSSRSQVQLAIVARALGNKDQELSYWQKASSLCQMYRSHPAWSAPH